LHLIQKIVEKQENEVQNNNLQVKIDLEKINFLSIRKKSGQNKQIFGSISEQEIINKIFSITGHNIDKKQIQIDPIKQIGKYACKIKIDETMISEIEVHILPNQAENLNN